MELLPEQKDILVHVGEQVLLALASVSTEVATALESPSPQPDPFLPDVARQAVGAVLSANRDSLKLLRREPLIARVVVEWVDTSSPRPEVLYVCRTSAAGIGQSLSEGKLTSYRAPLGHLAEFQAGEYAEVLIDNQWREARILERAQFRPDEDDSGWDALEDAFEFLDWRVALDSVRRLLDLVREEAADKSDVLAQLFAEVEEQEIFRERRRRQTIDRIALRDQPILDRYQGEVFRLPLNRRLFLLGPPGTGKTTTLIRRLAQKRTADALTTEETERLDAFGLRQEFISGESWVMFSPTELLKRYLRDAFNREGVPATPQNLRTWESERNDLARNVFRILRGANSGRFIMTDASPLVDPTSAGVTQLHDEFAAYVDSDILRRCSEAIVKIEQPNDGEAVSILGRIRSRFGEAPPVMSTIHAFAQNQEIFSPAVKSLDREIAEAQKSIANRLLGSRPQLLDELIGLVSSRANTEEQDPEDDDDAEDMDEDEDVGRTVESKKKQAVELLLRVVRRLAVDAAEGERPSRGLTGQAVTLIIGQNPSQSDLSHLGRKIALRRRLRLLESGARRLISDVPQIYARFRREAIRDGRFYDARRLGRPHTISPLEVDVLILVALRNAHRAAERMTEPHWLRPILDRHMMQVFVDEATDFSAVQLACMAELSHPKLRSWFACGDFRQRVTTFGIRSPDDLNWIQNTTQTAIEIREVTIGYRQSQSLVELAAALVIDTEIPQHPGPHPANLDHEDVPPLLAENVAGAALARWLSFRILEIERLIGRLPSIAIFVDGDDSIDPLLSEVALVLAERNLQIVGCKAGRDVGEAREVRIFDIQHIKGLEFEAVFFVGVDTLAARIPELFDRYLYVGITRAATYLGLTCESSLPAGLEHVPAHFSTGTWLD